MSTTTTRHKRILLLDDDAANRKWVATRIVEKPEYDVVEASNLTQALGACTTSVQESRPFDYLLVDVSLGEQVGIAANERGIDAVAAIVRLLPDIKSIAYSAKIAIDIELKARLAGAYRYFYSANLHEVLNDSLASLDELAEMEAEIGNLRDQGNSLFTIVDTVSIGVSFFDMHGAIWYMNKWNRELSGVQKLPHACCWVACHKFLHRSTWCSNCAVYPAVRDGKTRDTLALLPIGHKLRFLRISATPLRSSRAPERIIGAAEVVADITGEWEARPANRRVRDIVETLSHFEVRQPIRNGDILQYRNIAFDAVRLYTVLSSGTLLGGSCTSNTNEQPAFARWFMPISDLLLPDWVQAIRIGRSYFWEGPSCFLHDSLSRHRALVPLTVASGQAQLVVALLELVRSDVAITPEELSDLQPYFSHLAKETIAAFVENDKNQNSRLSDAVREFVNDANRAETVEDLLRLAGSCLERSLQPVSWHFRTLDRRKRALILQRGDKLGKGTYYEIADAERHLDGDPMGSAQAVISRTAIWETNPDVNNIARGIAEKTLTTKHWDALSAIRSFATLPLELCGRSFGALSVQFEDDSLHLESSRNFLVGMQQALASALGQIVHREHKQRELELFRTLDSLPVYTEQNEDTGSMDKRVLRSIINALFELTSSALVYYRSYDKVSGDCVLEPELTVGAMPPGTPMPLRNPPGTGIVGEVLRTRKGQFCADVLGLNRPQWARAAQDTVASEAERAFLQWARCVIAVPLQSATAVEGVIVAANGLPGWLNQEDFEIVNEFSNKASNLLVRLRAMRQRDEQVRSSKSLGQVTLEMARARDEEACVRLALFALTDGTCFGFSRAMLFLLDETTGFLRGYKAIGAIDGTEAKAIWSLLSNSSAQERLGACLRDPEVETALEAHIRGVSLCLKDELALNSLMSDQSPHLSQPWLLRQPGQSHFVADPRLCTLLRDSAYAAVPLIAGNKKLGCVFIDRSWLTPHEIESSALDMVRLFIEETALLIHNRRLDLETARKEVERLMGRGFGHSLRSRIGLLEGSLLRLRAGIDSDHMGVFEQVWARLEFLKRAGELFKKVLLARQITGFELVDIVAIMKRVVAVYADTRITLSLNCEHAMVRGDSVTIEEAFAQIVQNALDFIDNKIGLLKVTITDQEHECQIDFKDNGLGIHPGIRNSLFQPFIKYPSRRFGLGLALVAATIEDVHQGIVDVIDDQDRGAHFRIMLLHERKKTR